MLRRLVDELLTAIPFPESDHGIERLLKAAAQQWSGGVSLVSNPDGYTRTRAYRDENFELLLLNWAPGAASPIHDHGGQRCWMLVLSGKLQVDDYARLDRGNVRGYAHIEAEESRVLEAGGVDARAGRFDLHRVSATPDSEAVSLHVYAKPLRRYMIYDDVLRRCETAFGTYDDVLRAYAVPTA